MKTRLLIFFVVGILSYASIFGITNSEARCLEDPCYYYSPPRVIDASGNSLNSILVGQQIQVTVDVANGKDYKQPFVALLYIVDENNFSVSLNWVSGVLDPNSSFSPGTSWIPEKSGYYTATIYIWESLERTVPLAPVRTTSIDVLPKNDLSGTQNNFVQCKDNLVLIQRYDSSLACVKPEIYAKLIIRGWASVPTYDEYMSHEIEIPDDVDASELQRIIKENESALNADSIKISSDSNIPESPSELPVFKSVVIKKSVANVASLASSEFGIRGNVERFPEGYAIYDSSSGQIMFYDNGAFNYTSYKYDASAQLDFSQNYGKYRTQVFKLISDFIANLKDRELFPTHLDYNIERYWHP